MMNIGHPMVVSLTKRIRTGTMNQRQKSRKPKSYEDQGLKEAGKRSP